MNQRLPGPASAPGLGTALAQLALAAFGLVFAAVLALVLGTVLLVLAAVWLLRAAWAKLTGQPVGPWTALAGAVWSQWRARRTFGRRAPAPQAAPASPFAGEEGSPLKRGPEDVTDVVPRAPRE